MAGGLRVATFYELSGILGQAVASDTTYLTVVDKDGNIASWIQSLYGGFGSGVTVEGMGFALQNRGAGFTLEAKHPNVLAGGKRPFHTIIPAFMERGDLHIGFGIMGGPNPELSKLAGMGLDGHWKQGRWGS